MSFNPSSKICLSKRLVIVSLILFFVGLSVIFFSTLSSSINKTTSSKASGTESTAMQDFGGKGNPCAINSDTKEYYCNADTSLVCSGSLDFWLSSQTTRDNIMSVKKTMLEMGPKCLDPADVPMGTKGNLCRKEEPGKRQCDSGLVCAQVLNADRTGKMDETSITQALIDYLTMVYKGTGKTDLAFTMFKDPQGQERLANDKPIALFNSVKHFTYAYPNNASSYFVDPPSICIPESLSKVESCGDVGQKPCLNELGQYVCFGDARISYDEAVKIKCVAKHIVKKKELYQCDSHSLTCNDFCALNNSKCVETCEVKGLGYLKGDEEPKEMILRGGLFGQGQIGITFNDKVMSGTCSQNYFPPYGPDSVLWQLCTKLDNTRCCCDVK